MLKTAMSQHDSIRAVEWKDNHLVLLDQRKLPQNEQYISLYNAEDTAEAIRNMVVRGAPAIGIAAAYALVMAARKSYKQYPKDWRVRLEAEKDILWNSRPTAVNLMWALKRMCEVLDSITGDPEPALLAMAQRIHKEDIEANYLMGALGASLIEPSHGVLTHCNTGSLATGGYGTALGVIRSTYAAGKIEHVYADETRPWWQGSRLTAWELVKDKIPAHLICEGAAAHLMKQGKVSWVIVGSDRIAANGDVANKIGTYSLAVNARYHGVKFMVVAPTSTVDMATASGADIPIEQRPPEEVLNVGAQRIAAPGIQAWNPAFDVTPASLIDAIVTEKGIVEQPNAAKMAALMAK
ncbi:MAG: S-methyl-5-thioribose-1-phosphate isomerase [Candidatus Thiocaldithrix dubininis]|mgnify:CR=1 FL=1|uniref:Methylthioribose-1-phosphate isomerase n=1 Tax=Candidatus Thiocaldithrix dubininis TaxID=3080823 RepID=A0AA95KGC0_9GAMM|nr:MAG: S-methyl-5-thioribose-1-phosphate isomerase [Candidatus Thiocaldithrix dubininis]